VGLFDDLFGRPEAPDDDDASDALAEYERQQVLVEFDISLKNMVGFFYMHLQDHEADIRKAAAKHRDKLLSKREALVAVDDYGEADLSAWHAEALEYLKKHAAFDQHLLDAKDTLRDSAEETPALRDVARDLLRRFQSDAITTLEYEMGIGPSRPREPGDDLAGKIRVDLLILRQSR
jgi:hypothetical protein